MTNNKKIIAYFDGACWPNPGGRAAYGCFVRDGDKVLLEAGFPIGEGETMSCNVAEYAGVIQILKFLKEKRFTKRRIVIRGDSKLVFKQMSGKWKIKNGLYADDARKAKKLAADFTALRFEWIRRERNRTCDALADNVLSFMPGVVFTT